MAPTVGGHALADAGRSMHEQVVTAGASKSERARRARRATRLLAVECKASSPCALSTLCVSFS
jgi:hypothetical protein